MELIEPGDLFKVAYGNGKEIEVKALSLRHKRALVGAMAVVSNPETSPVDKLQGIEDALKLCVPDLPDHLLDTLDEQTAMQIVSATIAKGQVSKEQEKKSE
jgi:hypothetical protein